MEVSVLLIMKRKFGSVSSNIESFLKIVEQHGEITELTSKVARSFIERIVVHEAVWEVPGNVHLPRTQEVHIYLSYIGEFIE